ncbi:coproporphyrinogen III oxidase [Aphanothece hegewaldii CCALA 016]|uniref:Heme chaperone HemW n=1 Tax=Aphanothece hegewaldii CCALA 016 TaxID=2107694 RepID=A0A2T1M3P6_9CHRO|nr:radical SAM family heme chaperone HemW [Aphanothece hegewaldii]PSF39442.1 coproporphyrinogen III oxidase [Aphanothece hegewaldii CCALA 016]
MLSLSKTDVFSHLDQPYSAYLHIPFCRRRCFYCDFPISVLGNHIDIETSKAIGEYVEVLCQEIKATPSLGYPLKTIFFGGGTPSLLPVKYLDLILQTLDQQFGIDANLELSMEMDPGTFTLQQLQGYQLCGVNRVSLGVQAFQDELLKVCGRSHFVQDIYNAIDLICQANVTNFSLDLISGLPHQTLENWDHSLSEAIKIAPNHLSCYDLVLEPVTAFGKRYEGGENPLPTDEATAQMYRLAQNKLTEAGYEHYEISNYAKSGFQCRHNRVYWENRAYYGFGMGAASYTHRQRLNRPRNRKEYYPWVQQLQENKGKIDYPQSSTTDILLETLMLGLRLRSGISLSKIREQFGETVQQKIIDSLQKYHAQGWIDYISSDGSNLERIKLTDPEGFLFSNTVLATLFKHLDDS